MTLLVALHALQGSGLGARPAVTWGWDGAAPAVRAGINANDRGDNGEGDQLFRGRPKWRGAQKHRENYGRGRAKSPRSARATGSITRGGRFLAPRTRLSPDWTDQRKPRSRGRPGGAPARITVRCGERSGAGGIMGSGTQPRNAISSLSFRVPQPKPSPSGAKIASRESSI